MRPAWADAGHDTLAADVAADVAERIVHGSVAGGTVLTEAQVAADAGVSRTPVREAMLQLERWGLVRLLPKKGAIVVTPSADEIRNLLDLRRLFEVAAVEDAVPDAARRARLVADLTAGLQRQASALAGGDLTGFSECDVDFHLRIIAAGDNAVVDEVMRSLAPRLARVIHDVSRGDPDGARAFHADHEAIARAVQAGDVAAAREAVVAHTSGLRHLRLGARA